MRGAKKAVDRLGRTYQVTEIPQPKTFDDGFTYLFGRGARSLMVLNLSAFEWSLLMCLVAGDHRLDFVTFRELPQDDIAAALGKSQPTVSKALARLRLLNIIESQNRGGAKSRARYRMSPFFFWRGTAGAYWAAKAQRGKEDRAPRRKSLVQEVSEQMQLLPPAERKDE